MKKMSDVVIIGGVFLVLFVVIVVTCLKPSKTVQSNNITTIVPIVPSPNDEDSDRYEELIQIPR